MGRIFEVIGTPNSDTELEFLQSKESIKYVKSFPKRERANLKDVYPGTESRGIQLLHQMLEFNPNKRITAAEAIQDPYFDDIRLPEQEKYDAPSIDLSIDDHGNENLTIEELKKLCFETLKDITSDNFDFQNDKGEDFEDYW